jgi:hypothetical protein
MINNELKLKQSWFTVIRIHIKEHKRISFFINTFIFLPVPLFWIKTLISLLPSRVLNELPIKKHELKKLIGAKGILIDIKTNDGTRVYIHNI